MLLLLILKLFLELAKRRALLVIDLTDDSLNIVVIGEVLHEDALPVVDLLLPDFGNGGAFALQVLAFEVIHDLLLPHLVVVVGLLELLPLLVLESLVSCGVINTCTHKLLCQPIAQLLGRLPTSLGILTDDCFSLRLLLGKCQHRGLELACPNAIKVLQAVLHLEAVLLVDLGHQLTCEFVRWYLLLHFIETLLESLTTCVLPEVTLLRGHLGLGLGAFLSLLLAEVELFFGFALPTVSAAGELVG